MSEWISSVDFWVKELTKDTSDFNISDAYIDVSGYGSWMWDCGYNAGLVNLQKIVNSYCVPQWISVKDRLPDYKSPVLVYSSFGNMYIEDFSFYKGLHNKVTYWMPIPTPPKSESECGKSLNE